MTNHERQSRRDFLQGRAAAKAVAGVVARAQDAIGAAIGELPGANLFTESPLSVTHQRPLMSLRRRAMACEFEIQLATGCDAETMQRMLDALDLLETLEAQMTVYRSDSDVLRINRMAAERPVAVESRLFALFELATRLHRETGGALDITSGPLSEIWGFSRRQGRMPAESEVAAALERVGMDQVVLDAANQSVVFRRAGLSLHLNCIGKGYALDRMAEFLAEGDVDNYLLHGGSSSVLARGDCPGGERAGWSIGLRNPLQPDEYLGEFVLINQALGTSGSATQSFVHEGRRYGHLLDPRTGRPAEGVFTATVVAATGAEADALSTAFYILGPAGTAEYCAAHPAVAAVLVCPAAAGEGVEIHAHNLDEKRWKPGSRR